MATATQERPARAKQAGGGKGATAEAGSTAKARGGSAKAAQQQTTTRLSDKVRANVIGCLDLASDEVRFRIIEMLAEREWNVGEMCEELGISQPGISHHLSLLRHARLAEAKRDGRLNIYNLTDTGRQLWAACGAYARAITSSA